jgi:hypothetical protein
MIIDKKFSIVIYAGSKPLNLMEKDAEIANNPIKSNEWDQMMQAIDSIHGAQQNDESIPIFWTTRYPLNDKFGNILYRYAPNAASTLKKLESKSAYYIVLRDSSLAPLKIPSHGTLVLGFGDAEDLPSVDPPIADKVLKDSFQYNFRPQIVNLRPYETYSYEWKVVASNWPVVATPSSGELKPATSTGFINASISFCPTTGVCSDNTLSFVLPEEGTIEKLEDPYATLQLSVRSKSFEGAESLSDQFTVRCDDCLPKPRLVLEGIGEPYIEEQDSDNAPIPSYSFNLSFTNLELGQTYSYVINTIKNEWPFYFATPTSGTFTVTSTKIEDNTIKNTMYFCPTTGLCPPNNTSIPAYNIPTYPKFLSDEPIFTTYNIILQASLINYDYVSDPFEISYKRV